ncbi:hypothetical protein DWB64_16025 [Fusibacter sp. A1]|nr:hypothetical protein DWB64_16025 [Fusibacter sp. A1]
MKITMNQYISRRLDGVEGEIPRLIHMLNKCFKQKNFINFWKYWNPIYGYILGYYVRKPLRKIFPQKIARSLTLVINGMFHDIVVSLIIGRIFFSVTLLFIIYSLILVIEENFNIEMNTTFSRITYNMTILLVPFFLLIILF